MKRRFSKFAYLIMKKIYILALAAIAVTASWADSRSAQQMQRIAQQKLGTNVTEALTVNRAKGSTVESQAYATFNAQNGKGFVIVGADDRLPEVLGYSTSGSLTEECMPPQLSAILQNLNAALPYIKGQTTDVTAYTPVDTLCTALWGQDNVFSSMCPEYKLAGAKDSVHCVTGCVATAMAQVIYYWGKQGKFPTQGSDTYYWTSSNKLSDGDSLKLPLYYDFSTPLDFDNMKDIYPNEVKTNYTEPDEMAVANLMKMCGALAKMQYGEESGTQPTFLDRSEKYYGFGKGAKLIRRCDYTNEEWKKILVEQIQKRYPILYGGNCTDSKHGHSFVLDGLSADGLFHVNWGWNGRSNMYFDLNYLNPGETYTGGRNSGLPYSYNNTAIIDFAPDENNQVSEYFANGIDYILDTQTLHVYQFATSSHARKGATVALQITPQKTKEKKYITLDQDVIDMLVPDSVLHNPYSAVGDTIVPLDVTTWKDGAYVIALVTKDPEETGSNIVRTPGNQYQTVEIIVKDGIVTNKQNYHPQVTLKAQFEPVNLPRANRYVAFNVKASSGSVSCNNLMTMIAIQKPDQMDAKISQTYDSIKNAVKEKKATILAVNMDAYQDTTYQLKVTMPSTPGTYKAFMIYESLNTKHAMSDTIDIEVAEPLFEDAKLVISEDGKENPESIKNADKTTTDFTATLNTTCDQLMMVRGFYSDNGGSIKDTIKIDTIYINGAKKGGSIYNSTALPESLRTLSSKYSYALACRIGISGTNDYDLMNESQYIRFKYEKKTTPTAIRKISGDAIVSEESPSVYDLYGRRVNPQTYRGIMIKNGKKLLN